MGLKRFLVISIIVMLGIMIPIKSEAMAERDLVIVEQPSNVVGALNSTVTFSTVARNGASYEWQYSPNYTSSWYTMSFINGYDKASFSVPITNQERLHNEYRCKIIGIDGEIAYTNVVAINSEKVSILKQPSSVKGKIGETVSFEISASKAKSYEWQYSPNYSSKWYTMNFVSGYNSNLFNVPLTNAERVDNDYRCKLTGEDGTVIYSNVVSIDSGKVKVVKQPSRPTGKMGDTVLFSIKAENVSSYEWQYSPDYTSNWYTMSFISGYNTAEFSVPITNVERLNNEYRCKMIGKDGKSIYSDVIKIIDSSKVTIDVQPVESAGKIGDSVTFKVVANNVTSYEWQYSPNYTSNWYTMSFVSGYDKSVFIVPLTNQERLNNEYRCKLYGPNGSVVYTDVVKVDTGELKITKQPLSPKGKVGDKVTLSVVAKNAESYEWQYSPDYTSVWYTMSFVEGYNKADFLIPITNVERLNNEYRCKIVGKNGTTMLSDIVRIDSGKMMILNQPKEPVGKQGDTVNFKVDALNVASYEWQYSPNYTSNWYTMSFINGYNTASFSVPLTNSERVNNEYRCKLVGNDKNVIYTDIVKVSDGHALITKQPVSQNKKLGEAFLVSVEAKNATSYEWQYSPEYTSNWYTMSFVNGYNTSAFSVPLSNIERLNNEYRCKIVGIDGKVVYTNIVKAVIDVKPTLTIKNDLAIATTTEPKYFVISIKNSTGTLLSNHTEDKFDNFSLNFSLVITQPGEYTVAAVAVDSVPDVYANAFDYASDASYVEKTFTAGNTRLETPSVYFDGDLVKFTTVANASRYYLVMTGYYLDGRAFRSTSDFLDPDEVSAGQVDWSHFWKDGSATGADRVSVDICALSSDYSKYYTSSHSTAEKYICNLEASFDSVGVTNEDSEDSNGDITFSAVLKKGGASVSAKERPSNITFKLYDFDKNVIATKAVTNYTIGANNCDISGKVHIAKSDLGDKSWKDVWYATVEYDLAIIGPSCHVVSDIVNNEYFRFKVNNEVEILNSNGEDVVPVDEDLTLVDEEVIDAEDAEEVEADDEADTTDDADMPATDDESDSDDAEADADDAA